MLARFLAIKNTIRIENISADPLTTGANTDCNLTMSGNILSNCNKLNINPSADKKTLFSNTINEPAIVKGNDKIKASLTAHTCLCEFNFNAIGTNNFSIKV